MRRRRSTADQPGGIAWRRPVGPLPGPEHLAAARRSWRLAARLGLLARHEWILASLAGLGLALIMFWPAMRHPGSTIPADIWDPTLQAWQMAWAGHAVKTDPGSLWHGNGFFPDDYSFAFSDTLLGYLPASLIGNGPAAALIRYNVLFVLLHALAFGGTYALVRQLGAGKLASAVAGVAFAYAPWRWGQAGHMHVLSVGGIPLALAMLARGHGLSLRNGLQLGTTRAGWAFAGWCVAAWQMTIGFGIGIPFGYVLGGIGSASALIWLVKGRPALGRRLVVADGLGLLVFAVVGAFMAYPYFKVLHRHPEAKRGIEEIAGFSPSLRSFLIAPGESRPWGAAHAGARAALTAPAENALLPGFTLYALAALGLFRSIWSRRTRLLLATGFVLCLYLALGTNAPFGGSAGYRVLYDLAPGWNAIRTPGRLVIWITLLLAILAAGAVGALAQRAQQLADEKRGGHLSTVTRLALLVPLALILLEGTNSLHYAVVPAQPAAMRTVAGPLLVLPSDPLTDENALLWSTTRFQRLVNGGSGFIPDSQLRTRRVAKSFPDAASVRYLRALGVKAVIVLKHDTSNPGDRDYVRAANAGISIAHLGITRRDDGDTLVYTLG